MYPFPDLAFPSDRVAGLAKYNSYLSLLYSLAGLAGATMRIPHAFLIPISGGQVRGGGARACAFRCRPGGEEQRWAPRALPPQVTITCANLVMFIVCLFIGSALSDNGVSFISLAVLACVGSGMGGGVFASSMSNISPYFPKRYAGIALGLNAGVGNLGTSVMQLTVPLVMSVSTLGVATIGGTHPQNAGWYWAILLGFALRESRAAGASPWPYSVRVCGRAPASGCTSCFGPPTGARGSCVRGCRRRAVLSSIVLNTMPRDGKSFLYNVGMFWYMTILGYVGVFVGAVVQIAVTASSARACHPGRSICAAAPSRVLVVAGITAGWQLLVVVLTCVLCVVTTVGLFLFATPLELRAQVKSQLAVAKDKNTWLMVMFYLACFGSFIGFSNTFPKLIVDMFGYIPYGSGIVNPNAPVATAFAWLGPLVGSCARPVGGSFADHYGGKRVTAIALALMFTFVIWGGTIIAEVRTAADPMEYWNRFLGCFLCELCSARARVVCGSDVDALARARRRSVLEHGNWHGVRVPNDPLRCQPLARAPFDWLDLRDVLVRWLHHPAALRYHNQDAGVRSDDVRPRRVLRGVLRHVVVPVLAKTRVQGIALLTRLVVVSIQQACAS